MYRPHITKLCFKNKMKKDILVNGIVIGSYDATGDYKKDIKAADKIIKEKGLHQEVTTNDSMFGQANHFSKVAENIYQDAFKVSPYKVYFMAPFVVNAAFSIEIYLKTIHNAYGNTIKGHHLYNIYNGMPRPGKAIFTQAAIDARRLYSIDEKEDIFSCLKNLSKAFEEWRYIYEKSELHVEIQEVRYIMHTCHEACLRVRDSIKKHNKTIKFARKKHVLGRRIQRGATYL